MSDDTFDTTIRLVHAAQGGDEQALNDLFVRYLPRTRSIVAARMGWRLKQVAEFDDIVQDTFMKVLRGLERFEARSEGSFRHWIAECVECAVRDAARHAGRAKRGGGKVRRLSDLGTDSLATAIFAGDDPTPSAVVRGHELEARIEASLLELPQRYRDVITLRSLCGMSYAEVTRILGLEREGTTRQVYSRAVQKLRDMIDA